MNNREKETGTEQVNIQPSETDSPDSAAESATGDPGRTPDKAEGSREVVEEELEEQS